MTIPYLEIAGAPLARGLAYGDQARGQVQRSIEVYSEAFAGRGVSWDRVRERAGVFVTTLEALGPECVEEMRGIARGADVRFEDVIALNARTELMYTQDEGCTVAVCLPEVTRASHTLMAQNWDWRPACSESVVVLSVTPDDGPEFLTFVEAGLLARCGVNAAGVGVTGNFLETADVAPRLGGSIAVLRRRLLGCTSLEQALRLIVRWPRAFPSNHLIADDRGEAIDCETTPREVFALHPHEGLLTHSNHFKAPAALARVEDRGIARYPDTLLRDRRLLGRLAGGVPSVTAEDLQDAMHDHYGAPNSICRHLPDGPVDDEAILTVGSVVMDLHQRTMWVSPGPPCEHDYTRYELGGSPSRRRAPTLQPS